MDPFVPGGGLGAAAARSAMTNRETLLQQLRMGEWSYPQTMNEKVNASVVFDIVFLVGFLLVWGWSLMPDAGKKYVRGKLSTLAPAPRDEYVPNVHGQAIVEYCLKGNFNGKQNMGLFKYVGFFTMEEVTNWLSVSFVSTIIVIKIICGSAAVNPASIIFVVIVGVVARHMRLGIKGADEDSKPWKQLPPFLMLVSLLFALWSYTDVWRSRVVDMGSVKHGHNMLYVVAGVLFVVAAFVKTYISTGNMATISDDEQRAKARALYDGEFAFYLTGFSTVIVGSAITIFVFSEAVFIAYAATEFYGIPFWFLQAIPFYFFVTSITMMCGLNSGMKSTPLVVGYNVLLTLIGSTTILFAQGHVCSFPGPDGKHIVLGCGALKNMGFKEVADDGDVLEMTSWAVESLGAFAILMHILLYVGARFSRYGLMQTIDNVCAKAETTNYSNKA